MANSSDTVSEDKLNWMFIHFLTCEVNEKLLGRFKETVSLLKHIFLHKSHKDLIFSLMTSNQLSCGSGPGTLHTSEVIIKALSLMWPNNKIRKTLDLGLVDSLSLSLSKAACED